MPAPTTIPELIAIHRQTIEHFAHAPAETEPVAFAGQVANLGLFCLGSTSLADAGDVLCYVARLLTAALDRPDGSQTQQEVLQAADRHLRNLAAYA